MKVRTFPRYTYFSFNPHVTMLYPTMTLPYFVSPFGTRTHRVRWVAIHYWDRKFSHASVGLWCGQSGFTEHKKSPTNRYTTKRAGSMYDVAPFHLPICATCEGRAIGSGQLDSDTINGRRVIYAPRLARTPTVRGMLADALAKVEE